MDWSMAVTICYKEFLTDGTTRLSTVIDRPYPQPLTYGYRCPWIHPPFRPPLGPNPTPPHHVVDLLPPLSPHRHQWPEVQGDLRGRQRLLRGVSGRLAGQKLT